MLMLSRRSRIDRTARRQAWVRSSSACGLLAKVTLGTAAIFATSAEHSSAEDGNETGIPQAEIATMTEMSLAEDALLEAMPRLRGLADSVLGKQLPAPDAADLFADDCQVLNTSQASEGNTLGARTIAGSIPQISTSTPPLRRTGDWASVPGELPAWKDLFASVEHVEHAAFQFLRGRTMQGTSGQRTISTDTKFSALAKTITGDWVGLESLILVDWVENPGGEWLISRWEQGPISRVSTPALLFEEVIDTALPGEIARSRARFSYHERNLIDLFQKGSFNVSKPIYAEFKDLDSSMQHPALSVVDIDRDGWDDLYVMGRWGRNLMLRNRGDGTMEDIAAKIGLDVEGLCNCACFADFDNDGDDDVFIGRSLERSQYFRNDGGVFTDASASATGKLPLPYLVSTISAADYNADGLLDVYFGMYGPTASAGDVRNWGRKFMPEGMVQEMARRQDESHRYLSLLGPPNLLLQNSGDGKFRVAPEAKYLAEWYNTHAGCWTDFDDDGLLDLYVCNDFAPDHLFRQELDPESGARRFVEISATVAGAAMQGFGMGASWGDFDRDGDLDLYVSNMYSKAGKRITGAIPGLDARVPHAAAGNLLFRNDGDRFTEIAAAVGVAKAGWAYGAQFFDADNDGWLDIYSANGFYTAPPELRTGKDL